MTLIARISKLFQADMHSVLDKIEEPELLLRQSIREMELIIINNERHSRCCDYEQQQLTSKQDQLAKSLTELEEKLLLCFQSNKDDLARSLIKQKLETQQTKLMLAEKITAFRENSARLTKQLAEHRAQLASMKQKAEIFLAEDRTHSTNVKFTPAFVRDEDVEIAFLCEKQKWSES
jgi:phage shock protein A